ncbi:MAG: hypothetical protein ABIP48_15655 [Planctomycetota bacterium]
MSFDDRSGWHVWITAAVLALVVAWPVAGRGAELTGAEALRAAVEHLVAEFGPRYPLGREYLKRLEALQSRATAAAGADPPRAEFDALTREALLANPLVCERPIVFVVRRQYASDHHNTGTVFQPEEINAGSFRGTAAVKQIDFGRGGRVSTLVELPEGVARDLDVDYDGRRLLLAIRRAQDDTYHVYQMEADGAKLAQLTFDPAVSDLDPCYLPDGRIVFASTRDPKYCGCNRHIQANLFVMEADGANIRQIGRNNLFESRPSVMPDGRLLYDRWEYVDRHFGPSFGLWTSNPDGTNHVLLFGNNAWNPGAIFDGRAIPGTQLVVCVFGACHDRPWGAMVVLDRRRAMDGLEAVVQSWPPDLRPFMPNPTDVPRKSGIEHPHAGVIDAFKGLPVKYEDPYPLSAHFFLSSRMTGQGERMGIYLVDTFGNELLLHAEGEGCFDPMPLGPRPRPPVVTPRIALEEPTGTFFVADVYRGSGMQRVPRGTIRWIRVVEAPAKRFWSRHHWHIDTHQAPAMNYNCTNNKGILGDAPVEPDGSASFEAPADRFLFFQALDADRMMVQSMRSGATVRPGETVGCVGCHEGRSASAPVKTENGAPMALCRPPSRLTPWYGPEREFSYAAEVQPVWDRHCVACHDYGTEGGDVLNLAGDPGLVFNTSYLALRTKSPIRWHRDQPGEAKPLVKAVDDGPPQVLPPYSWGSHRSRLVDLLRGDHYDAKLSPEEFDRVVTWIDLNAPYYGSYATVYPENPFGRSPLGPSELARLAELTGVPVDAPNVGAELGGSQVSFTRPELSPCLTALEATADPRYQEALAIIRTGRDRLASLPRADMQDFRPVGELCRRGEARLEVRRQAEAHARQALLSGERTYDEPGLKP